MRMRMEVEFFQEFCLVLEVLEALGLKVKRHGYGILTCLRRGRMYGDGHESRTDRSVTYKLQHSILSLRC